jgi:tRNA uridine 5-carboxymethylaminomethyl modification enzyme
MRSERRLAAAVKQLAETTVNPDRATREALAEALGIGLDSPTTLYKLLQRQDLDIFRMADWASEALGGLSREEKGILESRVRYSGYIRREKEKLERLKPFEARAIPTDFDYSGIAGLTREVIEKCSRRRPRTVGEAARIPGVTPAAVAIISAHVARGGALSA